jgi:hypothetical protein
MTERPKEIGLNPETVSAFIDEGEMNASEANLLAGYAGYSAAQAIIGAAEAGGPPLSDTEKQQIRNYVGPTVAAEFLGQVMEQVTKTDPE